MTTSKMNKGMMNMLFITLLFCFLVSSGTEGNGLSYDYNFTPECLEIPLKPQYNGGIVVNPDMNQGLKGWLASGGGAKLEHREEESKDGNKFVALVDRNASDHSLLQKFYLDKTQLYTVSAWLRLSHGESQVAAVVKTSTGSAYVGWSIARSGCWSMLKGGLTVNNSGPVELHFLSDDPKVEIFVDSVSLQPFSEKEWKLHRDQSIDNVRRSKVKFQAVDDQGIALANAKIFIKQLSNGFPFGCAVSKNILSNQAYQDWFTSRFKYAVFENEMKWYSTEKSQGNENYSVPDSMLEFAQEHNIQVRGHNVFWDDPNYTPSWVRQLSPDQLSPALDRRINSVMQRYSGKLIHWDVVNENVHFEFLESRIGKNASALYYKKAYEIDNMAIPFLNDYNTIENSRDQASSPALYLAKINQLRSMGYQGPLGIGLEGHFSVPNLPYVRSAIDVLASANLPIWITELDVSTRPNQEVYLEQIIREVHAHPAVKGILIWAAWSPQGCYRMCLTDNNFKNLPTGDVVDKILAELTMTSRDLLEGTTDANGFFTTSLFHGDYEVQVIMSNVPSMGNTAAAIARRFRVTSSTNMKTLKIKQNKIPFNAMNVSSKLTYVTLSTPGKCI